MNTPEKAASKTSTMLLYLAVVMTPLLLSLAGGTGMKATAAEKFAFYSLQLAFPLLALQPVLAARLRILDRFFGLDIVYLYHKVMGLTAVTILIAAFLPLAVEVDTGVSAFWIGLPGVSSLLAVVLTGTALLYKQLRLSYERWRRLHNVLAVSILILVFAHGFFETGSGNIVVSAAWTLLLLAGGAVYIRHRLIAPLQRRKNPYRVEEIRPEAHNVWTLKLKPPKTDKRFDFRPGQFQFLTFLGPEIPTEEHPFTIASSPSADGWHESTIKESGDFTSRLGRIKTGHPVAVQAPFGRFSYTRHPDETDLVFIAGGIGITPLMSMLRHMRDTAVNLRVTLFYANRGEEDIVFKEELEAMASGVRPQLSVVHVLSKPAESWPGERGHIDASVIKRHLDGRLKDKAFYVCGPPPMMSAVIADITTLGVPFSNVRSERFAL